MIFCVEDDTNIRELIEYTLISTGFEAKSFECGKDFFEALATQKPSLILLDIMLPDTDGIEILKKIRSSKEYADVPVIMLTAKSERMDKIKGLDSGADDYITKPFDVLELVSRVKAVLRRYTPNQASGGILERANIKLDTKKHTVYSKGKEVVLTLKEYNLLNMLLEAEGDVVTREKIISEVWETDFEGESRTLDVHIRTLRQKLGETGNAIETVRNVGYRIE